MNVAVLTYCLTIAIGSIVTNAQPVEEAKSLFEEFKAEYGKNYNSHDEEQKRFEIFKDNLKRAEQQQRDELGTAEYGVTKFSDLTPEEFAARYLNARFDTIPQPERMAEIPQMESIPDQIDWRKKGAVTPVEDQGSCGSCYSFSVVANIEGQWFRKTGKLLTLSKQQIVDCDELDRGCDGGYPPYTYKEIKRMGGLQTARDYPYTGRPSRCHMRRAQVAARIDDFVKFGKNETEHAKWIAENGPLSSAMNAAHLQAYKRGIHHPRSCPPQLGHAVLTVGYGVERGRKFWIVKNTWGRNWGEDGYFRICRGHGECGINELCTSAIIR